MSIERIPYLVTDPIFIEKIEVFNDERRRIHDSWHAYAVSKGGKDAVFMPWKCIGVVFLDCDRLPPKWYHPKWMDKHSFLNEAYIPRKNTLDDIELSKLPRCPGLEFFANLLKYDPHKHCPPGPDHGFIVGQVGYVLKEGSHYLSIPTYYLKQHPVPEGLREITISEWLKIQEDEK